jgi:hypothetical protein
MDAKDKKWESGPEQTFDDERSDEQVNRAKEEVERRNGNLEGGYKEKNGDEDEQFTDLKSEPKQDNKKTHPDTD